MSNENVERVHITPVGDKVTILHGNINVHQFQGTRYWLNSLASVVDLVKWKGSKEHTVIFYNDEEIQVILDDTVMDRPQDKATYGFTHSEPFKEWKAVLGDVLTQKEFVEFLRRRPQGEITEIETLLSTVQRLKLATQIIGDYAYDDNNNISFMFKIGDTEGSAKLPAVLNVTIPLFNESDKVTKLEVELELRKPKAENEKPVFVLTCPKLNRYLKEAADYEVAKLKGSLDGYLILAGGRGQ